MLQRVNAIEETQIQYETGLMSTRSCQKSVLTQDFKDSFLCLLCTQQPSPPYYCLNLSSATMLTKLRARNFKCFEDVEIALGNPVVLVGPNNSGKATVLQALAL